MMITGDCAANKTEDMTTGMVTSKDCKKSDPTTVWGLVGGHIINFDCFNQFNAPQDEGREVGKPEIYLSNPDCDATDVDLTSLTSSSEDNTKLYWIMIPASFSGSGDELIDF